MTIQSFPQPHPSLDIANFFRRVINIKKLKNKNMPKKKNIKADDNDKVVKKITKQGKKVDGDSSGDEEPVTGEDSALDPAIIEDTFTEEFSEYNDVDNF